MAFLSSCLMHRDLLQYESSQSNQFNFKDDQFHIEIVKDYKFKIYPFLFIEKSGKKNSWLVTASYTTPHIETKSITTDLIITNQRDEILFESKEKRVDLIAFDGYNAKTFDLGTFKKEITTNLQDTLIAVYELNTQIDTATYSIVDTTYLILKRKKKSGSFY